MNNQLIAQSFHLLNYVTAIPSGEIIHALKAFRIATLEVMENRSTSTVYRIRQTGKVYQQNDDGTLTEYQCYEEYQRAPPYDEPLVINPQKPPVYIVEGKYVIRVKAPRFRAEYTDNFNLFNIEWIDPIPQEITANANLRKAYYFLKNHI